eukprot:1158619-Karenia_brevis.AAC.1
MRSKGLSHDMISFNAAIADCETLLLHDVHRKVLSAEVISFKAAISDCENSGQQQRLSSLLND